MAAELGKARLEHLQRRVVLQGVRSRVVEGHDHPLMNKEVVGRKVKMAVRSLILSLFKRFS